MMTRTSGDQGSREQSGWDSHGYSLLEVILAMFVLVIGVLSLLALFGQSMVVISLSQEELITQQKAREAMESIYTARTTQQISFDDLQNVPNGIFLSGFQALRLPNPASGGGDGLVGTADDGDIETLNLPGPDGQLGTADDESRQLTNFQRQILIEPVLHPDLTPYTDLRKVTVTVRYTTKEGFERSFQLESYFSRYR